MAGLQKRNGSYRILFSFHGKLHSFTLGKVSESEAETKSRQVDYLLMRLKQKLIELPDDIDIVTFIEHDGKPPILKASTPETPRKAVTLIRLKERYLETLANGTVEASSRATTAMHLRHLCRHFGDGIPLADLTLSKLQRYVDKRAVEKISATTIQKEVASLRAAWNWGTPMNLTTGAFPGKGLRYPKVDEKPPFMSWTEIKRHIAAGADASLLWECLYLDSKEISDFLRYVKRHIAHSWIYPALCFAAHTGVRRSELIRALVADVDFKSGTVLIREKKRSRGQRTHRRVPLTPFLIAILKKWLKIHPGGAYLFCHGEVVARSKKRSATTGYQGSKTRPTSQAGRIAKVRQRTNVSAAGITRDEFHDHFKRTLAGSKWDVLRGLHVLRHSFISACASKGVDQRLLDEWVGHQTDEQRRRYRHLWPSVQLAAIRSVFC